MTWLVRSASAATAQFQADSCETDPSIESEPYADIVVRTVSKSIPGGNRHDVLL